MEVSADTLFQMIGNMHIELSLVRGQLAAAQQATILAVAEVNRLTALLADKPDKTTPAMGG